MNFQPYSLSGFIPPINYLGGRGAVGAETEKGVLFLKIGHDSCPIPTYPTPGPGRGCCSETVLENVSRGSILRTASFSSEQCVPALSWYLTRYNIGLRTPSPEEPYIVTLYGMCQYGCTGRGFRAGHVQPGTQPQPFKREGCAG